MRSSKAVSLRGTELGCLASHKGLAGKFWLRDGTSELLWLTPKVNSGITHNYSKEIETFCFEISTILAALSEERAPENNMNHKVDSGLL